MTLDVERLTTSAHSEYFESHAAALGKVLEHFRNDKKFLLTTHENPDGDGLGSLLAMTAGLDQLGKDTVMFMSEDELPLPDEYRLLNLDAVVSSAPGDLSERTIVFLDCGNIDRMPVDFLRDEDVCILNIDHHHDNTCFGDVSLVMGEASCTAEIVYGLLVDLGVEITEEMAVALYVALITDTGKFMYENTTASAHIMAADLIKRGVDVQGVFQHLYEDIPFAKLTLLTRVLSRTEVYDDGVLVMAQLLKEDYDYAEAEASFSDGIIDHLRALRGTKVAALMRELLNGANKIKVSLRATDDSVDVSAIARKAGGGGHRRAAGFTTEIPTDKIVQFIRSEVQAQLVDAGATSGPKKSYEAN